MIGAAIVPKVFFEDSTDAYFVNSCSSDAKIEIATCFSPTTGRKEKAEWNSCKRQSDKNLNGRKGNFNSKSSKTGARQTNKEMCDGHDFGCQEGCRKKQSVISGNSKENSTEILSSLQSGVIACEDQVSIESTNASYVGRTQRNLRRKLPIDYKLMHNGVTVCKPHQPFKSSEDGHSVLSSLSFCQTLPSASGDNKVGSVESRAEYNQIDNTFCSPVLSPVTRNLRPRKEVNYKDLSSISWALGKENEVVEISRKSNVARSPVTRNLRPRKELNYKDLSSIFWALGKQNEVVEISQKLNVARSPVLKLGSTPNAWESSPAFSPDMFEIRSMWPKEQGNSSENKSKLASEFKGVLNDFVSDRNRCKGRAVHQECNGSSLFSTLSFGAKKDQSDITVSMHGFSTIYHSSGDDERHGNVVSDDENVNHNIAAAKRISTPTALASPAKPAQTLYITPQNQVQHISTDSASQASRLCQFSPIQNVSKDTQHFPPAESSCSTLSPKDIPSLPSSTATHGSVAILQQIRHETSIPSKLNIKSRRSARSPGSHLSSSVIKVDQGGSMRMSEIRRRTLDPVRIDLSSAILRSQNCDEVIRPSFTPECERISGTDTKVLLTPLNRSFVQLLSSSGNRVRLKSFGIVDALTPKRLTSADGKVLTAREKVLYECEQTSPKSFEEALEGVIPDSCFKLGEGLYGEVFKCDFAGGPDAIAIKVIPIEGTIIVNEEKQKTFVEVLPEIISSKELHNLRYGEENSTSGFIELHRVSCVRGKYPALLLSAWDAFSEKKNSDNDRPDMFPEEQLYLVFQYADGGTDAEHFKFTSAAQAFSVLKQICASLAVAEDSLEFEHRDLHWGNVLVSRTSQKEITGKIRGKEFKMASRGVRASIIDFTLSRLSKGGVTVFQNLAVDASLFEMDSSEDYQFEIYRMMKVATKNNWSMFQPKNNVFWVHYLCDKFRREVKFTRRKTGFHRAFLAKLSELDKGILQYKSCVEILQSNCSLSLNGDLR